MKPWQRSLASCYVLLLFSSCDPSSRPPAEVSPPADFEIRWGSGATHAEWGREEGTLNAKGELSWVKSRGYGQNASREEARGQASPEQILGVWRAINESRFFDLRKSYDNAAVQDGFSEFIAVTADGRSHSVSVLNTSQPRFSQVMKALNELVLSVVPGAPTKDDAP